MLGRLERSSNALLPTPKIEPVITAEFFDQFIFGLLSFGGSGGPVSLGFSGSGGLIIGGTGPGSSRMNQSRSPVLRLRVIMIFILFLL